MTDDERKVIEDRILANLQRQGIDARVAWSRACQAPRWHIFDVSSVTGPKLIALLPPDHESLLAVSRAAPQLDYFNFLDEGADQ